MPFPLTERIIYKNNPLDRVICQLRFPPILRIESEVPARFQEMIRQDFSNFSERVELNIEVPNPTEAAPEALGKLVKSSATKNYEFVSEDELWKVNLTRNFISLTANNYDRWENFRTKLLIPLQALTEIYGPTYFTRIGLRYINVVRRSKLGLSNVRWDELFKPHILGMLASRDVQDEITTCESRYDIELKELRGTVRIVTRFVEAKDNGEPSYMIDSDFFSTNKVHVSAALENLDSFSRKGTTLFQWCITERLHIAMEPETL